MSLKFYNTETVTSRRSTNSAPKIMFSPKGIIRFNNTATEALKLKEGSKVTFAQNPKKPTEWYLILGNKEGFNLRINKGQATFNCKVVCEDVRNCLIDVEDDKSAKVSVATTPIEIDGVKCFTITLK
jgi:hypothetical protein